MRIYSFLISESYQVYTTEIDDRTIPAPYLQPSTKGPFTSHFRRHRLGKNASIARTYNTNETSSIKNSPEYYMILEI